MKTTRILLAMALVVSAGCSDDDVEDNNCVLAAGDLLITEIMYYPNSDRLEWVEIFNTTSTAKSLKKLEISAGKDSSSASRYLNRKAKEIQGNSYMIIGIGKLKGDGGATEPVDLMWDISHRLNNTNGGTVFLKCGGKEISRVTFTPGSNNWVKAKKGQSIQLTSKVATASPVDVKAAGTATNWCLPTKTYTKDSYGSPGKANEECPPPPKCDYKPGDLLITEIMSDPKGTYKDYEWFEIYNNTGAKVSSLAGLCLKIWSTNSLDKKANYSASITKTIPLGKGGFVAVGNGAGGTERPWIGYHWTKLSLTNSGATIGLYCDDKCDKSDLNTSKRKIHQVKYGGTTGGPKKPSKGVSKGLAGTFFTGAKIGITVTDNQGNWCDGAAIYDTKNKDMGTPGKVNGTCTTANCTHPARDGDLKINEVMANGPGDENNEKEWIEVYVAKAAKDNKLDLLGLEMVYGKDLTNSPKSAKITGTGCMTVNVGERVLLARKQSGTVKCGVTGTHIVGGTAISNSGGYVGMRRTSDNKIMAKVQYPSTKDGVAYNRDETSDKWCAATTKYCTDPSSSKDGLGTPGKANTKCP